MIALLWLRSCLGSALGWFIANPWRIIVTALLVWSAFATWRMHILSNQLDAFKQTQKEATMIAQQTKATVETSQALVTKDEDKNIRDRIDAAVSRVRSDNQARTADLPNVPESAQHPDGASTAAVVDDKATCAEAVVKAQGWQDWYNKEEAVYSASMYSAAKPK